MGNGLFLFMGKGQRAKGKGKNLTKVPVAFDRNFDTDSGGSGYTRLEY
jgi:hypothetical protein